MYMIIAIIRPKKWAAVREALSQIEVERMTVSDALGFADQPDSDTKTIPKKLTQVIWVEIIVNDDFLEKTIGMIQRIGRTGTEGLPGDGKVFVMPVDDVVRVYDGAHGKSAV